MPVKRIEKIEMPTRDAHDRAHDFKEVNEGYDYGLTMAVNSLDEVWYSGTLVVKSEVFGAFTLQPYGSELAGEQEGMDSYLLRLGSGVPVCASPPTANAGRDRTSCEDNISFIGSGFGGGASSIIWTTSGDGTFTDNTSLFTDYIPGTNDLANGTVLITLTTDDPDGAGSCVAASDDVVITIEKISLVDAGHCVLKSVRHEIHCAFYQWPG